MDKHQEQGKPLLDGSVNGSEAGPVELDMGASVSKPKQQRPLKWRVYAYVFIAALANLLFGFEMSVISQVKDDFAASHGLASGSASIAFLASGLPIGAVFGSVVAGILQDKLGRRITLICTTAGYMGSVLVSFFADAFPQLAGGRLLTGVTIGIFSSTVPMYIAELSPATVRGRLVTVNQVCICAGIMAGYAVDMALSPNWQWCLFCGLPLAAVLFLAFIFIAPYSPRWLLAKGRQAEARAVLLLIRDADEVEAELEAIEKTRDESKHITMKTAFAAPHVRWSVTLGVAMAFIQQWTGCNAVNMYAQNVLASAGFNSADSKEQAIYIGAAKLIMVVVALSLMDYAGRRALLLWGTAGMGLSLGALAALLQAAQGYVSVPAAISYSSAGSLFLYMGFFEISLGPVLWLLLSELYPLSIRGLAMSIGTTACWLFTFSVTQLFPLMEDVMNAYGVFYLFSAACFAAWVWMWYYVPETRNKSLEEIETALKAGKA